MRKERDASFDFFFLAFFFFCLLVVCGYFFVVLVFVGIIMKSGMLLVMVGLVLLVQGEETIGVNRKTYSSATQFFGDVETVTLFAQV